MKIIKKVSVRNMINTSTGHRIVNQFIISTPDGLYFQSYNSMIAVRSNGHVFLDRDQWDYSVTTGKDRNQFLSETKRETERKIKSGEHKLVNLN